MEANKDYCPTLEGKEFGLAQIFLDLFDRSYNKYILAEIPKVKDFNYKKLQDFVDAYVAKAKEHFEASRVVKLVPYQGDDFKSNFQKQPPPQRQQQSDFRKPFHQRTPDNNHAREGTFSKRLNYVDVTMEDDNSDCESSSVAEGAFIETHMDEKHNDVKSLDSYDEHNLRDEDTADEENQQVLQAIEGKPDYVKGCVNYALYGNCFLGEKCKNIQGHNESVAKDTRQWMIQKLFSHPGVSAKAASNTSQFPRKIMRRDRENDRNYE